jgi:hypothetical protein
MYSQAFNARYTFAGIISLIWNNFDYPVVFNLKKKTTATATVSASGSHGLQQ